MCVQSFNGSSDPFLYFSLRNKNILKLLLHRFVLLIGRRGLLDSPSPRDFVSSDLFYNSTFLINPASSS